MQVSFKQDNKIEIPKHDVNEEVLFFDHVNGIFDYGTVSQLQVVKTEQYQTIAYAITLSNGNTLPCVRLPTLTPVTVKSSVNTLSTGNFSILFPPFLVFNFMYF